MSYKKILKKQEFRLDILKKIRFIPDRWMILMQYYLKLGRIPNLNSPKRFSEKLQVYKLKYRNPLLTIAADKLGVRNYIMKKGLDDILIKLYKVYDRADDINFDELPQKFILKTTNGSGTNIICVDKNQLNKLETIEQVNIWMNRDMYAAGREWAYKNIEPKIIIEELLEDANNPEDGINDYKFLCFNGEVKYIILDISRFSGHKRNIYDLDWNLLQVGTDKPNINYETQKPENLEDMIKIASKLCEDFPFVRVDLYTVNKKIYFGELTFYPWTGYIQFTPDDFDYQLGELFKLDF